MASRSAILADRYYDDLRTGLAEGPPAEIAQIADRLHEAVVNNQKVFAFGNGACAALAAHMACDLGKGSASDLSAPSTQLPASQRLRIISLPDNSALMTAYGNDVDYESVFVEPLKNLLDAGDVVIGLSGSGSSPNVLRAMEYARARDASTISFTGTRKSSQKIAALSDVTLRAPSEVMEQIEDYHVMYHHIIALILRSKLGTSPAGWE
jgi:D-sedoheptulose 7-phosphate isomerase